jgi:hypothetical protein
VGVGKSHAMYERISDKFITREQFVKRIAKHVLYVVFILACSVTAGAIGFIVFEGHGVEDAVLHAAYILSGFGLIKIPTSPIGKMFAGIFGLYANLFFLAAFSVIFAPVVHRILHKLHLDDEVEP